MICCKIGIFKNVIEGIWESNNFFLEFKYFSNFGWVIFVAYIFKYNI